MAEGRQGPSDGGHIAGIESVDMGIHRFNKGGEQLAVVPVRIK